ncbi:MAG: hypothetical protein KGN84_02355, partial [Acidobacteriota bacterium]|nr:hypothetical protein [Acidobacteriota bacterium]
LGVTTPAVASGAGAPGDTLAAPALSPTLTIAAESASVQSANLIPGMVGLYQVTITVPGDAPNGDLPLVLTQGTAMSLPVVLPVHK